MGKEQEEYKLTPGPQTKRSIHDIFFLLLFFLFWIGMFVIAYFAHKHGDVDRLRYGVDSYGNLCSKVNPNFDASALPVLFYFKPGVKGGYTRCIEKCPSVEFTTSNDYICKLNATQSLNLVTFGNQISDGDCVPAWKSKKIMNRCVPLELANITMEAFMDDVNSRDFVTQALQSVTESWQIILIASASSIVFAFIWLILIYLFSGVVVWLTVIGSLLVNWGVSGYVWYNFYLLKTGQALRTTGVEMIDSRLSNEQTMLTIGIVSGVVTLILSLLFLAARKRIGLAIQIVKETSKAIRSMPLILAFPIIKNIWMFALVAFFLGISALLVTSGENVANVVNQQVSNQTGLTFKSNTILTGLVYYYVFGLFWTWNYIVALSQTTIAGAIAAWYWTRDKRAIKSPVWTSFWRALFFHTGSLALGSLIIAIVQFIRFLLMNVERRLKNANNQMAQTILRCLQCVFWCLEKFLKFLNKNAYIQIAVYGYSFCQGARKAFELLMRNAFRLIVVDRVGDFLLFLGKLLISALSCLLALVLLQQKADDVEYYAMPLIFVFIAAYGVASLFISVFDMGIDTMFLCFCEDGERNAQSGQWYAPDGLRQFMEKAEKSAPKVGDGKTEAK